MALEFHGPVIDALSVEARMTMSNMAIEVGAKTGLMQADEKTLAWFEGRGDKTPAPVSPDADASYADDASRSMRARSDRRSPSLTPSTTSRRSRRSRARRSRRA